MATSKRKPIELDQVDWTLLEDLQVDARRSHSALARKVKLSPPAVAERIARLERAGVIRGYFASVDATQLGWRIEAIVHFRRPRGAHENAVAAITAIPEVIECHRESRHPRFRTSDPPVVPRAHGYSVDSSDARLRVAGCGAVGSRRERDITAQLAAIHSRLGGRLGVYTLDTRSRRTFGFSDQDRFAMC